MIKYDHHIKIYYKDVDQMGIVYYSRYYEYFEEARTELLASIGLDVMEVEKRGITLPEFLAIVTIKEVQNLNKIFWLRHR